LITVLFSIFLTPITTVMFPSFSKLNGDQLKIKYHFKQVNKVVIMIILPIGIGIFLLSNEIVGLFLGPKWSDLSAVIGYLALAEAIGTFCGINPIIYQSIGRPDLQPKLSMILIAPYLLVYWYVIPFGMMPLLLAKLTLAIVTTPINMIIMVRVLKLSPFYIFHQAKYIFLSCIILAIYILAQKLLLTYLNLNYDIIVLLSSIVFGIFIYFILLWNLDRIFIKQFITSIKKLIN